MIKRVLFTVLLLIIGAASVYVGFKPIGPVAAWHDQNSETQRGIQKSLSEKIDQLVRARGSLQFVHGAVNVLHSTDVKSVYPSANPVETLAPVNKVLGRISALSGFALGTLVFEKMLLTISISIILMLLVPIVVIISIFNVWNYRDENKLHKLVIASVLIILMLAAVLPVTLMLTSSAEKLILSNNLEAIMTSLAEIEKSAVSFDTELKRFRRTEAAIAGYITTARNVSNSVIIEKTNYLIIFFIMYIVIPVLLLIVFYKLTRFGVKKILK